MPSNNKKPAKDYRLRNYGIKWHLRDRSGNPLPELGWFLQVSRKGDTVRVLPEDLELYNRVRLQHGLEAVDGEWTNIVSLARLTDKILITADPRPQPATPEQGVLALLGLSPQNRIALLVHEYWQHAFPDRERFLVLTDQGAKWKAAKGSDARVGISLYTDGGKKRPGIWMARADNAVFDKSQQMTPYLVEIEASEHIKPKVPAGLIGTTNMCRWFFPPKEYEHGYDLKDTVFFVVLCSGSFANPMSQKAEQTQEFRTRFQAAPGCLSQWHLCLGATPDAAFSAFQERFESVHRSRGNADGDNPLAR